MASGDGSVTSPTHRGGEECQNEGEVDVPSRTDKGRFWKRPWREVASSTRVLAPRRPYNVANTETLEEGAAPADSVGAGESHDEGYRIPPTLQGDGDRRTNSAHHPAPASVRRDGEGKLRQPRGAVPPDLGPHAQGRRIHLRSHELGRNECHRAHKGESRPEQPHGKSETLRGVQAAVLRARPHLQGEPDRGGQGDYASMRTR